MQISANAHIDLQLHTIHSDGKWTPEDLIEHLLREGFSVAAITDHDRVDIVPMLQEIARGKGFMLLPAVEMSTNWRGQWVDLLCFGVPEHESPLHALGAALLHRQRQNTLETVQAMVAQGYALADEEVQPILAAPAVQQPFRLVDLIKAHGYDSAERSAGRLLVEAGLKQLTQALGPVVEAAHQSGALALIAHPGNSDPYITFDEALLDELRAEIPIDGIEVHHPVHSPEQVARYQAYAEKHCLLTSAGSDSHAPEKAPIPYPAASSRSLLERLGVQVV